MSERPDPALLADILGAIQSIQTYTQDMDFQQFMADPRTQDAVVRNIEIIGEASKRISGRLRQMASDLPWKSIAGMRDRLIHGYFGVNYDIVWGIIQDELPGLKSRLQELLPDAGEQE